MYFSDQRSSRERGTPIRTLERIEGLRAPSWARGTRITIGGGTAAPRPGGTRFKLATRRIKAIAGMGAPYNRNPGQRRKSKAKPDRASAWQASARPASPGWRAPKTDRARKTMAAGEGRSRNQHQQGSARDGPKTRLSGAVERAETGATLENWRDVRDSDENYVYAIVLS